MADTTKKTTRSKKTTTKAAAGVPTAKAVAAAATAAEAQGQPAPAAVKAAVTAPSPAATAAKPAAPKAPEVKYISKTERLRMIEQAAYFRAEKHGFQGDSAAHWSAAEAEIDADLKRRNVKIA